MSIEQKNFKESLEETYAEPSLRRRRHIEKQYGNVNEIISGYYEKSLGRKEMTDRLSTMAVGEKGEHPSAQIYAYEQLIKSLAETDERQDQEEIAKEIVFDIALPINNPVRRAYFLGLLRHYSSEERLDEIEESLKTDKTEEVRLQDEHKIISTLITYAQKIRSGEEYDQLSPEEKQIIDYIVKDFPRGDDECEIARLISSHYGKEVNATRPPDPASKLLSDLLKEPGLKNEILNRMPDKVYVLPEGHHPSKEKIAEAAEWGIQLNPVAATFEETSKGRKKNYVYFDMDPDLSKLYFSRLRHYKDTGNTKKTAQIEAALRERVWRELDQEAKDKFGNDINNIVLLKQTIRDRLEEADEQSSAEPDELHQDIEKVLRVS